MMPDDRLSKKVEDFCLYYSEGFSSFDSAVKAGYKETTAGEQGSRLLNNVKVRAKLSELMKPIQDRLSESLKITKESQLRDLQSVKEIALKDNQLKTVISAITEQNKMLGFYEAEKKELSITGVQIITKDNEMNSLVNDLKEDV
jgi:phage terminase small subunit